MSTSSHSGHLLSPRRQGTGSSGVPGPFPSSRLHSAVRSAMACVGVGGELRLWSACGPPGCLALPSTLFSHLGAPHFRMKKQNDWKLGMRSVGKSQSRQEPSTNANTQSVIVESVLHTVLPFPEDRPGENGHTCRTEPANGPALPLSD